MAQPITAAPGEDGVVALSPLMLHRFGMRKRKSGAHGSRNGHIASEFGECYALSSREVLRKCRRLRDALRDSRTNGDWHLNWEHAIIQLRKVGHVLHKVDGTRSEFIGNAAKAAFSSWNDLDNKRFSWFQWIDAERNLVLKEDKPSVIFSLQEVHDEFVEPRVLVNSQLETGSMVVSNFIKNWVSEIEKIELEARSQKSNKRYFRARR